MWDVVVQVLFEELEILELLFFKIGKNVVRLVFGRGSWSLILDILKFKIQFKYLSEFVKYVIRYTWFNLEYKVRIYQYLDGIESFEEK